MTINKQELRLTAEKAKDNFMPNFMVPTRDVLALLDELEAAEKRIDTLQQDKDKVIDMSMERVSKLLARAEAAEKRIAELESERDKQGRHACELFDEVASQRQQIAELEAVGIITKVGE